jgi:ketosteroid isomerase-like protein
MATTLARAATLSAPLRGRSKTTGLPVDMSFAQVFTVRDGKQTRMEMYADPAEALKAVGLE